MGRLLDVAGGEGVGAFQDVLDEHRVQPLDGGLVLFLVEHCEHCLDVLLQEEVDGRLPELKDALGVEAGVDAHDDVGPLHLPGLDVSAKKGLSV